MNILANITLSERSQSIAMKYLETMTAITSGEGNKVVYMPYEATGILSSVDGIKQMFDKK